MRFKVDENLPAEFAQVLRSAGHDALSVFDQGLRGQGDSRIAQVCRAEARALVTLDLGFGDIRAYRPQDYPGLLVLRLRLQSKAHALAAFQRAMPLLGRQPLTGRLWIIEDSQVRIRGEDQAGQ